MERKRDCIDLDGREVRRRRRLAGVELAAFAARVGVSAGYVSHLENGIRKPSPTVFVNICDALGVPENQRELLLMTESAA